MQHVEYSLNLVLSCERQLLVGASRLCTLFFPQARTDRSRSASLMQHASRRPCNHELTDYSNDWVNPWHRNPPHWLKSRPTTATEKDVATHTDLPPCRHMAQVLLSPVPLMHTRTHTRTHARVLTFARARNSAAGQNKLRTGPCSTGCFGPRRKNICSARS